MRFCMKWNAAVSERHSPVVKELLLGQGFYTVKEFRIETIFFLQRGGWNSKPFGRKGLLRSPDL